MRARRYSFVVAEDSSGLTRSFTIRLRPTILITLATFVLPVLIGLGAMWKARTELDRLRVSNGALEVENGSYRAATAELTAQIQSLEEVINDLGARAHLDPAQARAIQKLPAVVKSRAAGRASIYNFAVSELAWAPVASAQ